VTSRPATTPLAGRWTAAASSEELRRSFAEPEVPDGDGWHVVEVPGHWQLHEPFAAHEGPVLHRHRFLTGAGAGVVAARPRPGQRAWLELGGIFYTSEVWLDGDLLGDTEGYFTAHTFEVTEQLEQRDEHLLAVEVSCSPARDPRNKRNLTGVYQHSDTLDDTRNPGGIWRPVTVRTTGPVRFLRHRVLCTEATSTRAVVEVQVTLDSLLPRTVRLRTTLGDVDHELHLPLAAGETTHEWTVVVNDAQLWWPRALGRPTLHELTCEVHLEDHDPERGAVEDAGGLSDRLVLHTGLRSVRRRDWAFELNGERLFLKGANQPPLRRFPAEETAGLIEAVTAAASGANLDLLRFWGHVPTPEVLEACDRAGLLCWVDLPLQWGYHRSVKPAALAQARALVDLHGHRPSIVLWCAHNEPFALRGHPPAPGNRLGRALHGVRLVGAHQLPSWNRTVLDPALAATLRTADPTREVEPHSGVLPHLPTLAGGDTHLFAGWRFGHDRTLGRLLRLLPRLGRFVSAFGAQSVPEHLPLGPSGSSGEPDWSELSRRHGLDLTSMAAHVPPSTDGDLAGWRTATQEHQAVLVHRQVGALRRLKHRPAGGFCVHFLADADDMVSCSLIDVEGRPKAGYDALVTACAPVVAVADPLPPRPRPGSRISLRIHLVNDLRHAASGVVTAELRWAGGGVRRRWSGAAGADQVARVGTLRARLPVPIGDAPRPRSGRPLLWLEVTFEGEGLRSVWHDAV
jgi:beta-mannosidase